MSEQLSTDSIQAAYAKLYEPYKQKAVDGKYQSLYEGYDDVQRLTEKLAEAVLPSVSNPLPKPKRKTTKDRRMDEDSQAMILEHFRGMETLRSLLRELFSGKRDWSRWLKSYNEIMDTKHPDYHGSVTRGEASLARKLVRKVLDERSRGVAKARIAGGKAGMKHPKAKEKRSPS
jgi:hypothetical protein